MKPIRNIRAILFLATLSMFASHLASGDALGPSPAESLQTEILERGVEGITDPDYKPGLLMHVVLFRYHEGVTQEQKRQVIERFLALRDLCRRNGRPYIVSIVTGSQNSAEGVDQGLEQGFIVTFSSEGDRNYYVGQPVFTDSAHYDPNHQAFKEFVGPLLHSPINPTGVVVFDFNVEGSGIQ